MSPSELPRENSEWPDNDPRSLRAAWLIAALDMAGFNPETRERDRPKWAAAREAAFNVVRLHSVTHWRSGVKLVSVEESDTESDTDAQRDGLSDREAGA